MIRYAQSAVLIALMLTTFGCSRDAAPAGTRSEGSEMRPAATETTPRARGIRPGCASNFAAFDDDGDGRVSEAEFIGQPHAYADPVAMFRNRDSDGDGSLTEAEFCSGWRGPQPGAGMHPKGGPGMGHGRVGEPMMGMRCEQHFDAFDADRDGKLTRDEFAAWPHARGDADTLFGERDRDGDGTVTPDEFCTQWK